MSRANVRTARDLATARIEESIQTKKSILKADAYGAAGTELAQKLDVANDQYLEKLSNLKKFTSKSKTNVRTISHQTEWMSEYTRLQNLANSIEVGIATALQSVLVATPEWSQIHEYLNSSEACNLSQRKNRSEIMDQLRNVKGMFQEAKKMAVKLGYHSVNASERQVVGTGEANPDNELNDGTDDTLGKLAVMSIIAELLVRIRDDQSKSWMNMKEQEQLLSKELSGLSSAINSMLRSDQQLVQDTKLKEEFLAIMEGLKEPQVLQQQGKGGSSSAISSSNSSSRKPSVSAGTGSSSIDINECVVTNSIDTTTEATEAISITATMHEIPSRASSSSSSSGSALIDSGDTSSIEMGLEMLMGDWLYKIAQLDKQQELKVLEREKQKIDFCAEVGIDHTIASVQYGGWTSDEHAIFAKVYKKAQVTGMKRKLMLELLTAQLKATRSLDEILTHEEWHRKMKSIALKYKESDAVYSTSRQDMAAQAKKELIALRSLRIEQLQREKELESHEQRRATMHRRLNELKAHKQLIEATRRHEELLLQESQLQQQQAEAEALQRERLLKKELVGQFKLLREQQERERLETERRESEAADKQAKMMIEQNKPKVALRAQKNDEKEARKRAKEAELAAEELKRIEILNKLAQQVPYFDAIQDASSKLDHITASAKAQEYIQHDAPTRGYIPLNGFTDVRVIKDTRFRLVEALRNCGVINSQAAQQAIAKVNPRPQLAIHGLL